MYITMIKKLGAAGFEKLIISLYVFVRAVEFRHHYLAQLVIICTVLFVIFMLPECELSKHMSL